MTPEEIARRYQIRRLGKEDHILTFDCGDNDLNDFILNESPRYRSARLAVTYVIEVKESDHVVGFFSLANDRVSISDFESKTEFNRFRKKRFVNEKRTLLSKKQIPAPKFRPRPGFRPYKIIVLRP